MYEPNVDLLMNRLQPTDVVLDIGGWARPFNRANYVLDAEPYETRGYYGAARAAQGGDKEFFTRDTWIRRDICEHTPFPFADKEIDFVVCSHTLEDIRDPLWVCSEMARVAKAGYVEVPSRLAESSRGTEAGQVGWSHHRWLVDIGETEIQFLMKYHMLHSHWRFSFPTSYLRQLSEAEQVQWMFWNGSFVFSERTIHGTDRIAEELESYVRRHRPYPEMLIAADRSVGQARALARRAAGRIRRIATMGARSSR